MNIIFETTTFNDLKPEVISRLRSFADQDSDTGVLLSGDYDFSAENIQVLLAHDFDRNEVVGWAVYYPLARVVSPTILGMYIATDFVNYGMEIDPNYLNRGIPGTAFLAMRITLLAMNTFGKLLADDDSPFFVNMAKKYKDIECPSQTKAWREGKIKEWAKSDRIRKKKAA